MSKEQADSPNMDGILERAIAFAAEKHQGQRRKGSHVPYIVHPMEAAAIVSSMTEDQELIAAAILHDTLEDCEGVTKEQLASLFGDKVAEWVDEESEVKQEDAAGSWKARKQTTIDQLSTGQCSREHLILTLGDKLSNLRAIHYDKSRRGEKVWERFNQKDKRLHAWYYRSIGQALSSLSDEPAWQEYNVLLGEVFGD